MADSESQTPISYSSFLVIIGLSRLVLEIFACDRQTDRQTDGVTTRVVAIAVDRHSGGPAIKEFRSGP